MPSVLLSTSGLDGVLHPVHLMKQKQPINPHLPHVYQEILQVNYVARQYQH